MNAKATSEAPQPAPATMFCSFCGKSQHDVKKLVAGPAVFICDECIALCDDIVREGDGRKRPADRKTPTPREICATLDDHVIGQDQAKRTLAVAIYNHYKRAEHAESAEE